MRFLLPALAVVLLAGAENPQPLATQATTAVVTGDAQFGVAASIELLKLVNRAQDFLAICGMNTNLTMQTIVSKAYAPPGGAT